MKAVDKCFNNIKVINFCWIKRGSYGLDERTL